MEKTTHHVPIVGCHIAIPFNQIVTVDSLCNFKIWDYETGELSLNRKSDVISTGNDLSAATLDWSCRRLITAAFNQQMTIWNYNSGAAIAELTLGLTSLVSVLSYAIVGGRRFLIIGGWDQTVRLFAEIAPGSFELWKEYRGHSDDISAVACGRANVVSGSVTGELFCWALETSIVHMKLALPKQAAIESLHGLEYTVFVGTANGSLHVIQIPKMAIQATHKAHGLRVPHSISAIGSDDKTLLFTGDTLGYIRKWRLSIDMDITVT
jgi:WD40 repeat protein